VVRKRRGRSIDGWLALDKPLHLTSTQALGRARHILDAAKAGHGGTLDPLATGVLPIALGEATKTVSFAMDSSKTYRFEMTWGTATETDDCEGAIIAKSDILPSEEAINAALLPFIGEITQIPPIYSAIKINGEPAYKLARERRQVKLKTRTVRIDRFEKIRMADADRTEFEVDCGKGTYIRALARDLAEKLGTYGHVSALRRTRCGPFEEKSAISLDKLAALGHKAADSMVILPVSTVLDDIPALALTEDEAGRMRHGQPISLLTVARRAPLSGITPGTFVRAMCGEKVVALATVADGFVKPVRVLNT